MCPKPEDLTGKRYGKLVALEKTDRKGSDGTYEWKCLCDCGNIYYATPGNLRRGRKNCGCETFRINLMGKQFGSLVVIKPAPKTNQHTKWICRCDCGNICTRETDTLLKSNNSGCDNCCHLRVDLVGKRFGRLTVNKLLKTQNNAAIWECKCDCGNLTTSTTNLLTSGKKKSCGCIKDEVIKKGTNLKHGKQSERLYKTWCGMKARTSNPNEKSYKDYGAKGVRVCDEWKNSFESFYEWAVSNGYEETLTIDRIDVNGDYEPNNCRWATTKEQQRNKRNTVKYKMFGIEKPLLEWCEILNIKYGTPYSRLRKGKNPFNEKEAKEIKKKLGDDFSEQQV